MFDLIRRSSHRSPALRAHDQRLVGFSRVGLLAAGLVFSLANATACTWIAAPAEGPGENPDGVQRCNTVTDCDEPSDPKYQMECVFGNGQSDDSPKVCVPRLADISCDFSADGVDKETAVYKKYKKARAGGTDRYKCETGGLGCGTADSDGDCKEGKREGGLCLKKRETEIVVLSEKSNYGLDVQDQFCRFYFCDEKMICGEGGKCVRCDEDDSVYKDGKYDESKLAKSSGCREVYVQGEPSDAYDDACFDGKNFDEAMDDSKAIGEVTREADKGGDEDGEED